MPVVGAKALHGPVHLGGHVVRVEQTRPVVGGVLDQVAQGRAAGPLGDRRPAPIGGDPEQPGAHRPARVEAADRPNGPEERFLDHILRILTVAKHPKAKAVNDRLMRRHEPGGCVGMT